MRRRPGSLVPILVALGLLAGCIGDDYYLPPPKAAPEVVGPVLRVGVTSTYPPVVFRQQGQVVGIEADFAALLGRQLSQTVQFVEVDWTRQIDELLAGRTDIIMSGMSITEARRVRVAFAEPYFDGGLMAAVRLEDAPRFPTPQTLLATYGSVGVIEGTTGAVFVQRSFPNARRIELSRASDGALALRQRSIDVFVHDAPAIAWLVSANEADMAVIRHPLNRESLAWAVRPTDSELLAKVNATLAAWKADGTLNGILVRWLPYLKKPA